ncbi:hypothetical protein ALC60_12356 [Trachymyrmex zeteki]|uniref:Transposase domain-containing protein n=1 Tax=Mycetomoellerius zeteki TaxID=64791 RepID=A0A151WL64_9HYME|nr:hypothetical protein ALC60_12356 [Trachymyrmex zeteki]
MESDIVDDFECNVQPTESESDSDDDNTNNDFAEETVTRSNMENEELANEIENNEDQFIQDITSWAIMFNIFHVALLALLVILRKYTNHAFVKDPRTLLKTPRHTAIIKMGLGEYCHFGFKNALKNMLDEYMKITGKINDNLDILINIDGLPISKSNNSALWPILCSDTILKSVFIVGVYFGQTKPQSNNDFLQPFVDEIISLINNGFFYNNINVRINLHALICDAPAKAFVLGVKTHTGYNSCTRCTIKGEHVDGRLCFPATKVVDCLRTDADFADNKYDDYQTGETILRHIPNFGLVSCVVIDYMHLICLGVVKKLILLWVEGPRAVKLSQQLLNHVSGALLNLQNTVPNNFVRRPRSLKEIKMWKATELRQFLLYTGPVVLKGILRQDIYINFITLHVIVTILASPTLSKDQNNITWAQKLVQYFLQCFKQIYGATFMSHNMHNLLHICSDVQKYGPVDEFRAFRFENYMSNIKKMLRKNEKPLQQLSRRYAEINKSNLFKTRKSSHEMNFKKLHSDGPVIDGYNFSVQYKVLHSKTYTIHAKNSANNCVLLKNGTIVVVLNFAKLNDNRTVIIGRKLKVVGNLYADPIYPCASEQLGVQITREDAAVCLWPCDQIHNKMWKMPYDRNDRNEFVVFPVLHT